MYYDGRALGVSDPVHRASHVTSVGFRWSRMPGMIPFTAEDRRVLALGREQGIGDGFTVPANGPGEGIGPRSFAHKHGRPIEHASPRTGGVQGTCGVAGGDLWGTGRHEK